MCFDSGKNTKVSLVLRSSTFWKNVVQAFSWNSFYGLDIEYNRTHQRTRWILIQMLTIIFAVQKLGNNIIFRIDRIKEEQRCRLVFFTLNRLSDAFTTLFFQHASAASNCPAKYILRSLRSTFVSEYVWPQTSGSHVTRLQRSRSPFVVHVWTSRKAVSSSWTPSTLFFFLLESSHVYPTNICEVVFSL